jgi:phosphoserine aminotransferase
VPLVCDSSSDFLSRPIAVNRYGLIYACAQKNAGIAGVTMAIIRDDLVERVPKNLPGMLDYANFVKNDSRPNTPPVFAIYAFMLVARWLKNEIGGLAKMAERNERKAKLLYDALDSSGGFYRPHARPDSRSQMNVTFRLPSEELEAAFVQEAKKLKLYDLKGHRSVGGIRASIYNAMPPEGVDTLAAFMRDFAKRSG